MPDDRVIFVSKSGTVFRDKFGTVKIDPPQSGWFNAPPIIKDLAAEIERLRAELAERTRELAERDNEPATLDFAEQVIGEASQAGLLSVRDGQLQWEGSITLTMKWEVRMLAELLKHQTGD